MLDSAIYTDHEDIAPNLDLSRSRSFVPGQPLQQASGFSHGTHVAGIIAAPINGVGVQVSRRRRPSLLFAFSETMAPVPGMALRGDLLRCVHPG